MLASSVRRYATVCLSLSPVVARERDLGLQRHDELGSAAVRWIPLLLERVSDAEVAPPKAPTSVRLNDRGTTGVRVGDVEVHIDGDRGVGLANDDEAILG